MFNFVRRWLHNRRRAIFKFWDGSRVRYCDPFVVMRGLSEHPEFDSDVHLELAISGGEGEAIKLAEEAIRVCVQASRDVFGIQPMDAGGLTEPEILDVLFAFVQWAADLKKNTEPTPISPEHSEPPPSDESTTPHGSGSGSTSNESSCDAAPKSCPV